MLKVVTDWWPYITGVVGAIWVAMKFFLGRMSEKTKPDETPKVSASNSSFAAGRDLNIGGNASAGARGADTPPAAP